LNLGGEPAEIEDIAGAIELATNRARDLEHVESRLRPEPAEGVIVLLD